MTWEPGYREGSATDQPDYQPPDPAAWWYADPDRPRLSARDWYCPNCGERLSYGVYCKTCKIEPGWEFRPATERSWQIQEAIDTLRALPLPDPPVGPDE